MHYKLGVSCVYNEHVLYSVVITWKSNPPISQFNSLCNEFTSVWSMFLYNIATKWNPYTCWGGESKGILSAIK